VHIVDIEKKEVVHKIVTENDVCFLHWTQETAENPNRYEAYQKLVSTILMTCFRTFVLYLWNHYLNSDARCGVQL
jgi:hypothetical protein